LLRITGAIGTGNPNICMLPVQPEGSMKSQFANFVFIGAAFASASLGLPSQARANGYLPQHIPGCLD